MPDDSVYQRLLSDAGSFHPHYGDRLAMHLPMVLTALHRLEATEDKLRSFYLGAIDGLIPLSSVPDEFHITSKEQQLGNSASFKGYLRFYRGKIKQNGASQVIREALPVLLPGLAASAFHALIRLAYGILARSEEEIAIALAYWSAEHQPFDVPDLFTSESLGEILLRTSSLTHKYSFSPGIIVDHMDEVAKLIAQQSVTMMPDKLDFNRIRQHCLAMYVQQDDFTLLHTVTGCHAFSIISPYIDDMEFALKALWKAVLIAQLSTALPFQADCSAQTRGDCDFTPLLEKARASNDSHLIKLVFSCIEEYQRYKEAGYFTVVCRECGIENHRQERQ